MERGVAFLSGVCHISADGESRNPAAVTESRESIEAQIAPSTLGRSRTHIPIAVPWYGGVVNVVVKSRASAATWLAQGPLRFRELVRLEGFEPPTLCSEDRCSSPLSYSRVSRLS